jgi:ABC-type multidrug transport system fused ATPase/permease subunit
VLRTAAKWPIWRQPPAAIALILAVCLAAVLTPASFWQAISSSNIEISVALGTLSIAYSTFTCSAERVRRTLHQGTEAVKYSNLLAIWGFAAAILLPLQLIWAVAVAGAVAEWPARRVAGRARLYRHIYSTAVAVLAATATHAVCSSGLDPWLGIVLGMPTYMTVEILLIGAAMLAARERSAARGLLQPGLYRAEICCLAIAVCVVVLVDVRLGMLVWLSLPAAIGLQRIVTRSRLQHVVEDAQLRPMAEEAWFIAATEVVAALPVVSIIRITTTDPVAVSAVAQMQAGCDAIGYLGADGLGMLLVDCPSLSAEALAARLRMALRKKGVEGKVAAAGKPRDGYRLNDLLAICEAELVARDAADLHDKPLPES